MADSLGRRAFLASTVPLAAGAWALSGAAPAAALDPSGALNLRDFGAVGDGTTNDAPALQAALDALGAARGGVLVVPPGRYLIASPVIKSFQDQASVVIIVGRGSSSQFIIRVGGSVDGITLAGVESLLLDNLVFTGTPGVATDAKAALRLNACVQVTLRRCDFYGVSSQVSDGAVVYAFQCDLRVLQCAFRGCSGSSAYATPVIENHNWRGIKVVDTDFIDYGTLNGTFVTKTPVTPGSSWIHVGNTFALTDCNKQHAVVLRNVRMDEGAQFGLLCAPALAQSARVSSVLISSLRVCTSGITGSRAVYILHADKVRIEHSWFGFATARREAIKLQNVGDAVIDSCRCEAGANVISADAATASLTVMETVYGELVSDARRTYVVNNGQWSAYYKAAAEVPPNTMVSWSPSAAERVDVTPLGADASSVVGVSLDTAAAGARLRVVTEQGALVQVRIDGSTAIQPGDALGVSTFIPGRVRRVTSGGVVGRAATGAAARSGLLVFMTLSPSTTGSGTGDALALQNGWANYGQGFAPAGYHRDATSRVYLMGVVRPGTTALGTTIFSLPVGYRPVADGLYSVATNAGTVQLRVKTTGEVVLFAGTADTYVSLDGTSFRTDSVAASV